MIGEIMQMALSAGAALAGVVLGVLSYRLGLADGMKVKTGETPKKLSEIKKDKEKEINKTKSEQEEQKLWENIDKFGASLNE